ncbi:MAG TPA: histidine kinase [Solirubrobacteraceae bacterium]|nr:histidine kinase [Solirubrobacteraceae bacterium]
MRPKLWVVAGAGVAAMVGAVYLAAHQMPDRPTEPDAVLTVVLGASLLGSGLASWRARPENRLGPVMVLTAFGFFASQLSEGTPAWMYTLGTAVQYLWLIGFLYLLLTFPSGRLSGRLDRWLMGGVVALLSLPILAMLDGNKAGLRCPDCPDNLIQIVHNNREALNLLGLERLVGSALLLVIVGVLIVRWRRASTGRRHAVAPVLIAGCATFVALAATATLDLFGDPFNALPANIFFYLAATVPIAVMFVFLQRQLARGGVAGLVVELGTPGAGAGLRQALARTLGDPSLELAFWFPAERCYVDGDGAPVRLPEGDGSRRATLVERDGQPIAALLHDAFLDDDAELVRSVCAAASLALENERLQAELRARLVDLQASRARLVGATDAERRRIERDLHDGTQQRLVSIAMSLGLLESKLPTQEGEARPLLRETREALTLALEELRELTHGINPPLLVEQGLSAALDELCRRAALPTHLHVRLDRRLPDHVESAAYFVASEALTNAAKHSHASEVQVAASYADATLTVEIADDGIGGAGTGGGSGLRGLADRVEALGGRFTVSSPPGRGTTLRAEIPCAEVPCA